MSKKKILLIITMLIILALIGYIVVDYIYPLFGLIPDWIFPTIYNYIVLIFYTNNFYFFLGSIFVNFIFGSIFGLGYTRCKKHRVSGTITYLIGLVSMIGLILVCIIYYFIGIIVANDISSPLKLVLVAAYVPLFYVFILILEVFFDSYNFLKDVIRQRHEYSKLDYKIVKIKEGRVIQIEIFRTSEDSKVKTLLEAAPQLVMEEALHKLGDGAVSRFIKSAASNIILQIASHLTGWPRAKIKLYRSIGAKIGKHCLIGHFNRLDPFQPNMIEIEDYVGFGMEVMLLAHSYLDREGIMAYRYGKIRICKHAKIGVRATILAGVTIGEGAVVAANSLVTKDVEPWTMVGGVPAKPLRKVAHSLADSLESKEKNNENVEDSND